MVKYELDNDRFLPIGVIKKVELIENENDTYIMATGFIWCDGTIKMLKLKI